MGYKLLGYLAWRSGKWMIRRRSRGKGKKVAVGGTLLSAAAAAALAAQRRVSSR
jgi:hypothetical protein